MQMIKVVSESGEERLCEVAGLYDCDGDETQDVDLAMAVMVKWDEDKYISFAPDCPVDSMFVRPS